MATSTTSTLTPYGVGEQAGIQTSTAAVQAQTSPGQDPYAKGLQTMMTSGFTSNDPSYAWRFQQGQQALERSQASKGLLGSGNAATELQAYGQGMASTEYQAQFQRLLQGSQLATNQYDTAINSLAKMGGMSISSFQSNQAAQAQSYGQQQNNEQQQGIRSGLEQMMSSGWGSSGTGSSSSSTPLYNSYSGSGGYGDYSNGGWSGSSGGSGYSGYTSLPSDMGYGQGYITSSSGNTSTFGGYSENTSGGSSSGGYSGGDYTGGVIYGNYSGDSTMSDYSGYTGE